MQSAITINITGSDGKTRTYTFTEKQMRNGDAKLMLFPGDRVELSGPSLSKSTLSRDCGDLIIKLPGNAFSQQASDSGNDVGSSDTGSGGSGSPPPSGEGELSIQLGNFFYIAPEFYENAPLLVLDPKYQFTNLDGAVRIDPAAAKGGDSKNNEDDESDGSNGGASGGQAVVFSQSQPGSTGGLDEGACSVSAEDGPGNISTFDTFSLLNQPPLSITSSNEPIILRPIVLQDRDPLDPVTPIVNNDPPQAADDRFTVVSPSSAPPGGFADPFTFTNNSSAVVLELTLNDSDPDGDSITITAVDPKNVNNGTLSLNNGVITFTPDTNQITTLGAGQSATDSFEYTIQDSKGNSSTATAFIDYSGENDGPAANDNLYNLQEGGTLNVNPVTDNDPIFGQDSDPDTGDSIDMRGINGQQFSGTVNVTLDPENTITADNSGNIIFNNTTTGLAPGQTSTVNFTYTITDTFGATSIANVTVTITGVNDPPVATDDGFTVGESGNLAGNVITIDNGNGIDNDPDSTGPLTLVSINGFSSIVGQSLTLSSGAILQVNSDGTLSYDPSGSSTFNALKVGETGTDTFDYTIQDTDGLTSTATVTITVQGENDPPDAIDDSASASENGGAITINLLGNDSDPDNDTLTVDSINTALTIGSVSINPNGTASYDPGNNFNNLAVGQTTTDSFEYTISDGNGGTDTATVTITISGTNDGPVAVNDSGVVSEDGPPATIAVLDNDSDVDGDTLTVTGIDTTGTLGTVTINGNNTINYNPNGMFDSLQTGQTATDTFTYTISDGNGGTDTATVTMTINGANDTPNAENNVYTTDEETATSGNIITDDTGQGVDNDPDGDPLTVSQVNGNAGAVGTLITLPSGASLTVNANGTFNYDPSTSASLNALKAGENGADTFTYEITDGTATDTATVTINLTGVNDTPTALNNAYTGDEDNAITGNIITDNTGAGVDSDPDNDPLVVSAIDGNAASVGNAVVLASGATLTVNADGNFNYDPTTSATFQAMAPGQSMNESFDYTISDGNGGTDTATVTFTVQGVNDNPDATDDDFVTNQATVVTGNVVTNNNGNGADSDPEGDGLTVTSINGNNGAIGSPFTLPSGAQVTISSGGAMSYNPGTAFISLGAGETDDDTFTYSISDGNGGSDTATVTVEVTGINDGPTALNNDYTTNEDTTSNGNVITDDTGSGVDSDPDTNDVLFVSSVNGSAGNVGTQITLATGALLTVNSNGTYSYDPNGQFENLQIGQTATDSFDYTITDGNGGFSTATVNLTIQGANDNPTPNDDTASTNEDSTTNGNVLTNDSDIDGGTLSVSQVNGSNITGAVTLPSGATLTQNTDGTFTYDPTTSLSLQSLNPGQQTTDNYTLTISDGNGGTSISNMVVTVDGINDAPVMSTTANTFNFDEDIPLSAIPTPTVASFVDTEQTDVDSGAVKGIAIINAPTTLLTLNGVQTVGAWQYSLDGGSNFLTMPTNLSDTNALILHPDALIRFVPVTDFSGNVTISYRGYDQTNGLPSGTLGANVTANGGTTAYSSQIGSTIVTVNAVNDAPILDNNLTPLITAIVEDVASAANTGMLVSNFLAAIFSDRDDLFVLNAGQLTPTGAAFTSAQGSNGIWQYSTDGGTNWLNFGLITLNNATVLGGNARIRFVPNANYTGTAEITVAGWDQTNGLTSGTTGVNVSTRGGQTSYSQNLETGVISVNPVNDPPVLDTNDTLIMTDGSTATITTAQLSVSDIDNTDDEIEFTILTLPANGTLRLNGTPLNATDTFTMEDVANNLVTFEHATTTGDQSFTFSVSDDQGGLIGTNTFNIEVNNPPVATNDNFTVGTNAAVVFNVLGNDSDSDGDTLTVENTLVSNPNQGGSAIVNGNGTISYQSAPFFTGNESFTYQINDGNGNTATAVVTVNVRNGAVRAASLGNDGTLIQGNVGNGNGGSDVAHAYDVNGDGLDEVVFGQLNSGIGGVVDLIFGQINPTTINTASLGAQGVRFSGITANAQAGISIASGGDINNDGLGDFVVGQPGVNSNNIGNVHHVHGDSAAAPLFAGLAPLESYAARTGNNTDAGTAVAGGDFNGDGLDDFAFTTPSTNLVTVVHGQTAAGSIATTGPAVGFFNIINAPNSTSNHNLAMIGDVSNGDRRSELAIGDPINNIVYIINGKTNTTAIDLNSLGANGVTVSGAAAGDEFGFAVSAAGDVNGDGISDYIIGAPGTTVGGVANAGAAYVIFGSTTPTSININSLGANGFIITPNNIDNLSGGDRLGSSVSAAGDVNGDGFDDVIIGAPNDDPSADDGAGRGYVVYGKADSNDVDLTDVLKGEGGFAINGDDTGDKAGSSVDGGFDFNGDGFSDVFVGVPDGDANGVNSGEGYVVFGGTYLTSVNFIGTAAGETLTGDTNANSMVAGRGNDTLVGNGGADVMFGGAGDDRFEVPDLNFARIDGGNGTDTLAFTNTNPITVNLTSLPLEQIRNIEAIDLNNGVADVINLNLADILVMSPNSNSFTLGGDSIDGGILNLSGGGFVMQAPGVTTTEFAGTNANVFIENDLLSSASFNVIV